MTFAVQSGAFTPVQNLGNFVDYHYNANDLTLVGKDYPTTNTAWKDYFFGDPNSPNAQPLANNGDGVPNLLKYALAQNPLNGGSNFGIGAATGSTTNSFEMEVNGVRYLAFTFVRPSGTAALTDVTYGAERATSLSSPDWSAADTMISNITPGPGVERETVTMRSTHPMSEAKREYLRLKVSLLP